MEIASAQQSEPCCKKSRFEFSGLPERIARGSWMDAGPVFAARDCVLTRRWRAEVILSVIS